MTAVTGPTERSRVGRSALAMLAAAWFFGFLCYFFRQTLPNNAPLTRGDVAREVPGLLIDSIFGVHDPGAPPSGWRYFPQRFDLIAVAAAVLIGSWHFGSLLLRGLVRSTGISLRDDAAEHFAQAGLLGLAAWSLVTLAFGLAGSLRADVSLSLLAGFTLIEQFLRWRTRSSSGPGTPFWKRRFLTGSLVGPIVVATVAPFVVAMVLGALLPPTDFDVKAYHLTGPKQWFQEGRISFLENNVYTSFPFLTEMLCLSTMVLRSDWFRGALAGQLVLAAFAPFAAAMIFSLVRRTFGTRAAWLSAALYLTTPWVYRISVIAYVEGALAAYLVASLAAYLRLPSGRTSAATSREVVGWSLLCGLSAGSAAACKYPGVISAVIPFAVAVAFSVRSLRAILAYSLGVALTFGPWLLKNLLQTGNPVFPLLWKVFGGRGFDSELAAKFDAGHSLPVEMIKSPSRWLPDLWAHVNDVAAASDWQSGLVFGLLPAAFLLRPAVAPPSAASDSSPLRTLRLTGLYLLWLFGAWWLLTHRIDRFWVPMLSILCILAGVGADQLLSIGEGASSFAARGLARGFRGLVVAAIACCVLFNLGFVVSAISGNNAFLLAEEAATEAAEAQSMALLNRALPPDSRTLLVGDAEVFDARRPVIAHSVFNRSLFEEWFAGPPGADGRRELKPAAEIREELKRRGITHLFVNWLEILRYRTTYGYSAFVAPERFRDLAASGVLSEIPLPPARTLRDVGSLPADKRTIVESWGPEFAAPIGGDVWFPGYQLFRVND